MDNPQIDDTVWTLHPTIPGVRLTRNGRFQTCWQKVYPTKKLGGGECLRMTDRWRDVPKYINKHYRRYYVTFYATRNGKPRAHRNFLVAVLLAETFIGPRPPGHLVCHNNGDSTDDRLENLRYDTPKGNSRDAIKHGVAPRGSKHGIAKLNEEKVAEIRKLLFYGERVTAIARQYGVSFPVIISIRDGKIWTHVPPYVPEPQPA
jgi:ketosteroid isomerase-like protein